MFDLLDKETATVDYFLFFLSLSFYFFFFFGGGQLLHITLFTRIIRKIPRIYYYIHYVVMYYVALTCVARVRIVF